MISIEGTPVSRLVKMSGAILFGLVFCAGAGASGTTTTTGKMKRHSAGTAHVATKLAAHSSASHPSAKSSVATKAGTTHHVATTKIVAGGSHGTHTTLAVRRTRYHEHFS